MASVLVVDDEDVLRAMIAALLEDLGHEAITAIDGYQALSILSAQEPLPALIISDVMMPRMSGVTLTREVRDNPRLRAAPIILMSAGGQPQEGHLADYFLSKPFDLDELTLWILDTGSPMFKPTQHSGPKLVGVDLTTDQVFQTILFPEDVALPTTYLNDVRFDLRRGDGGMAFITDSSDQGPNGIIVVDLASGSSWRKLHDHPSTKAVEGILPIVEGQPIMDRQPGQPPKSVALGSDGIAISADGSRLYYCPLASRRLYSVSIDALVDRTMSDEQVAATVVDEGDKGGVADGLQSDANGCVYVTSPEHDAILRRRADGQYETVVHDPRLLWPDTMHLAEDGYLYVTSNQLHRQARFHEGQDLRQKPYSLFRVGVDAQPVLLR